MKIVVFSDAHGNKRAIDRIYTFNQDAEYFVSLGDTEVDDEYLQKKGVLYVKGNYPRDPGFLYDSNLTIHNQRIFFTHGHKWSVRFGVKKLFNHAKENKYSIVLYGHTHVAKVDSKDDIMIINPGSCSRPRTTLPPTYLIMWIEANDFHYEFRDVLTNETIEL